jgi:hypothetical protein
MQSIPVFTKDILYSVRQETYQLLNLCKYNPGSPMIRPFLHSSNNCNSFVKVPMNSTDNWSLLIYLPRQQSFFVTSKGALIYNFNTKVKSCPSDSFNNECQIWKGTVLGVEKTLNDWYAIDAFVISGVNLMNLNYTQRKKQLIKLKETCMPNLLLADSLPHPNDVQSIPDVPLL